MSNALMSFNFYSLDCSARKSLISETISKLGYQGMKEAFRKMFLIRSFELKGESSYLDGHVGGFYHSYIGQEAIQTGAVFSLGKDHWFSTSYRCHALALLLDEPPSELMAELYGKETGNAKGRGGSMHFYSEKLLGGSGIVGGQVPLGAGAAFSIKYKNQKNLISLCFLGDGAVAQGSIHESLNICSLWNLPLALVIENNKWGMGTATTRAICSNSISTNLASAYELSSVTIDGSDFFSCFQGFITAKEIIEKTNKPVIVECLCERFKGHSISDAGTYRTKEDVKKATEKDPVELLRSVLISEKIATEEEIIAIEDSVKQEIIKAVEFALNSPWPSLASLEDGVYAS